jgi:hypothetical protein
MKNMREQTRSDSDSDSSSEAVEVKHVVAAVPHQLPTGKFLVKVYSPVEDFSVKM